MGRRHPSNDVRYHYEVSSRYAVELVAAALKRGELVRPDRCEECGTVDDSRTLLGRETGCRTVAHHDDYNKPLSVRWLCQSCHRRWHGSHRAIPLADFSVLPEPERLRVLSHFCRSAA